jgi:energy-coupling factor transporter ATP-binding protein EcfA2
MPAANKPVDRSIAMWGPPSSGKTTFLAALSIALQRRKYGLRLRGADEASELALINMMKELTRHQEFPDATEGIETYNWVLEGSFSAKRTPMFRRAGSADQVSVGLNLVDATGELTDPERVGFSERQELIEGIARSSGIVYIFDPIREFDKGDAFDHTYGMLIQLARYQAAQPGWMGARLPHYVAVCVTKFDEVPVYEAARRLNMIVPDPDDQYSFPRVRDDEARELFLRLCEASGSGNADMVINSLEQYFLPDRIKYFVTSAVGFYLDPRKRFFDEDDWQNVLPVERSVNSASKPHKKGKPVKIRGGIYPINIVEPISWLCQSIAHEPDRVRNVTRQ